MFLSRPTASAQGIRATNCVIVQSYLGWRMRMQAIASVGNDARQPIVIDDFVINEHVCNGHCAYCLCAERPWDQRVVPGATLNYKNGSLLYEQVHRMRELIDRRFRVGVLKVSGGEVTLIRNMTHLVFDLASRYAVVQLLTNGLLLNNRVIDELADIPNLVLQLSLDGHTLAMNSYRVASSEEHERLLTILDYAVSRGLRIEISCVITDRNAESLVGAAAFFMRYEGNVFFHPYPVRGGKWKQFFPAPNQYSGIEQILHQYDRVQPVVPARVYFERMLDMFNNGVRVGQCWVSALMLGSFNDGKVVHCPLGWTLKGNAFDSQENAFDQMGRCAMHQLMRSPTTRLPYCKRCFSAYDIMNLFVEGVVSAEEIRRSFIYDDPRVQAILADSKERLRGLA